MVGGLSEALLPMKGSIMSTRCIAPNEIKEGDFAKYIEGTASQSVRDHIAGCSACAAQVKALAQADRVLRRHLLRASCPSADALLGYVTRTLPADQQKHIAHHLKECPRCAAEVQELEQAEDTPGSLLWQQVARTARDLIRAVIIPPRPELILALRGSPHSLVLLRAGDLNIALDVEASDSGLLFLIRGRVMKRGHPTLQVTGRPVRLIRHDAVIARQEVDELGYFVFEEIPPGEYRLVLEYGDADVIVPDIHLPPEP